MQNLKNNFQRQNKKMEEHEHKEQRKDSDIIQISKLTVWKSATAILAILLVISIFTGGFGIKSGSPGTIEAQPGEAAQPAQPRQAAPTVATDMKTLIDDDTVKGDKNAKVTIVEWSDFECSFCTRFYKQTLPSIDKEYIKTGKVKFIFRDYPLSFHKNAQKASEAAECAGEQGKYYEMHDKLFEDGVKGGVDSFKQFAKDLGLDTSKFNDCLDSGKMEAETKKDMADGSAAGITGTPGFIINGKLVKGAQPFENFKAIIDAELAK